MRFKYIIRKLKLDNKNYFIPIILNNNEWKYLIKNGNNFMVSVNNKIGFEKIIDAYKFIASHRMSKNIKGKVRPKCYFFNELITFIPLFGIIYTLFKLNKNIPFKYMFSSLNILIFSISINFISLLILIMLL